MRHQFTQEERSRGGKTTSSQPEHIERCRDGFKATLENHPYFARKHLRRFIKASNLGIPAPELLGKCNGECRR